MRTVIFTIVIFGAAAASAAPRHIHLSWQGATRTTMTVTWRSTAATGEVEYGPTSGHGKKVTAQSMSFDGSHLHSAMLTGLSAGATVHYRCGRQGDWSGDRTFRTAPQSASAPYRFVAIGDSRSDDAKRKVVTNAVLSRKPAFSIHTGDFVSDGQIQSQWNQWFATMEPLLASSPLMGAIGNHENHASNYYKQFAFPTHAPPKSGVPVEAYYSWDFASTHFVALSTEHSPAAGDHQHAWLKKDLIAAAKRPHIKWIVAFAHRPPYSSGPHGNNASLQKAWGPLFESLGVDVTFWGHDHTYERHHPLFQGHRVPAGGVVYIVTGGAGAPLYTANGGATTAVAKKLYHYIEVNVQGDQMKIEAKEPSGNIFDSLTLKKPGPKAKWIMDGAIDSAAKKIGSGGAELTALHAGFDGRYLYVATGGAPASRDHFILLSPTKSTGQAGAPWSKKGKVWNHAATLTMEATNGWSAWEERAMIPFGAVWKYHDKGVDLGSGWRSAGFDDSAWSAGPAELGYGDGDEATKLASPGTKYPSVYFRKTVTLSKVPASARLSVVHDDGVAVWINGKQVLAKYVDNGTSHGAWASSQSSDNQQTTAVINQASQNVFKTGKNVIAVMVKQVASSSSDTSFNLKLEAGTALASYTRASNPAGPVMEGMVDLVKAYGSVPASVFLAAAAYGSSNGDALQEQIPKGNGNGDLDTGEWIEFKLKTTTDGGPGDGPAVATDGKGPKGDASHTGDSPIHGGDRSGVDSGCSCEIGARHPASALPPLALLALVALAIRRRRA